MISDETRQKMRDAWKERKKIPFSQETRQKMTLARQGEKNPNWKGGTIKYKADETRKRDNYTCQKCGYRDEKVMVVDHVVPRFVRADLALHSTNLMTLCPNCHARKTSEDRKNIAKLKRQKELMLRSRRYQNSYCRNNYLHDFRQIQQTSRGYLERCTRCGKQMHFPMDVPNHIYLSYHLRSALQVNDPLFFREYPKAIKS